MFDNERCITSRVQKDISVSIQTMLWNMIDNLQGIIELDYLQSFILKDNTITHEQEKPEYMHIIEVPFSVSEPIKIYVIDNGTYSTMLLVE